MLKNIFGNWRNAVPVYMRVVLGVAFFLYGYQKVFRIGFAGMTKYFATVVGFPVPMLFGFVASYLELLGGIALIIGFQTRWVALLFCIEMLVAIFGRHITYGFFYGPPNNQGFANVLNLLTMSLTLLILGSGRWSVDKAKGWDE
ncbi:MAG: DoxX family protein [Candidatus Tectomicrobia bacterium]|nr:DoxX family protein [Candidatus Tectomicrobia bacterium]